MASYTHHYVKLSSRVPPKQWPTTSFAEIYFTKRYHTIQISKNGVQTLIEDAVEPTFMSMFRLHPTVLACPEARKEKFYSMLCFFEYEDSYVFESLIAEMEAFLVDTARILGEEMIHGLSMVAEIEVVLVVEEEDLGLEGLKRVKFGEEEGGACVICLEELWGGGREVTGMLCSHLFHRRCLVRWLEESDSCPICRKKIHSF